MKIECPECGSSDTSRTGLTLASDESYVYRDGWCNECNCEFTIYYDLTKVEAT